MNNAVFEAASACRLAKEALRRVPTSTLNDSEACNYRDAMFAVTQLIEELDARQFAPARDTEDAK